MHILLAKFVTVHFIGLHFSVSVLCNGVDYREFNEKFHLIIMTDRSNLRGRGCCLFQGIMQVSAGMD